MRSRTKTQASLPSEDAVLLLLLGPLRSGQVRLRRLVGWQDLNSLKSQAALAPRTNMTSPAAPKPSWRC